MGSAVSANLLKGLAEEAPVMISLLPGVNALEDVVSSDKGLVRAGRADRSCSSARPCRSMARRRRGAR
jgi:3-hydroxyisobutyrate dehydrogenase-like beta-hydroxyacid dehydrogenase